MGWQVCLCRDEDALGESAIQLHHFGAIAAPMAVGDLGLKVEATRGLLETLQRAVIALQESALRVAALAEAQKLPGCSLTPKLGTVPDSQHLRYDNPMPLRYTREPAVQDNLGSEVLRRIRSAE